MEQGSIEELILTRSVTKHIRKNNKRFAVTHGVGVDYSQILLEGALVTAEAVYREPAIAWTKAFNNIYMSGGRPVGGRITMLLPLDVEEADIKGYMSSFNALADNSGLQIMGGETKVSDCFAHPCFQVTAYGEAFCWQPKTKSIEEGFDIIMAGEAGCMGVRLIGKKRYEDLVKHFSKSYIDEFLVAEADYSVEKISSVLAYENTFYMHDVSTGGVHGALWQLGTRINKGLAINHFAIPIKQETIEICECFNLNPYMLEGTGAVVAVVKAGEEAVRRLNSAGIVASVIGKVDANKEKVVFINDEKRFLAPVKGDEIYKVIEI